LALISPAGKGDVGREPDDVALTSNDIEFSNWREMCLFAEDGVGIARDEADDWFDGRAE
jgi:hypothetical protein